MNRILKGDKVRVISGKHKNAEGVVLTVFPKEQTAIVENVNKVKMHKKAGPNQEESGIIQKDAPIRLCKLALIDPKSKKSSITKVKFEIDKNGNKSRIAKTSGHNFTVKTK
jgi:large subunit ribosomal protein L24